MARGKCNVVPHTGDRSRIAQGLFCEGRRSSHSPRAVIARRRKGMADKVSAKAPIQGVDPGWCFIRAPASTHHIVHHHAPARPEPSAPHAQSGASRRSSADRAAAGSVDQIPPMLWRTGPIQRLSRRSDHRTRRMQRPISGSLQESARCVRQNRTDREPCFRKGGLSDLRPSVNPGVNPAVNSGVNPDCQLRCQPRRQPHWHWDTARNRQAIGAAILPGFTRKTSYTGRY